jgi:Protein of unknown function (DUF1569)
MKTLLNSRDEKELFSRLERVRPESARRWGKMSAHQMICHLNDAHKLYMGMIETAAPGFPFPSRAIKWAVLWAPVPWAHGVRTLREIDQMVAGTRPNQFERDVAELKELMRRFTRQPRDFEWSAHPYFGRMSEPEWMRLGYLHTDHHLRQFGA